MVIAQAQPTHNPLVTLKQFWGYEQFRDPQAQIINPILDGQDVLILLPTGAGKSICFQLPAVMQSGLSIVVSPLVSLMENQVQELREKNINAALIHGQQSRRTRHQVLAALRQGRLKLIYLSPETLLSPPIWMVLQEVSASIHTLVIDEAHCLVQWGTTFRPVYRRLGVVRDALVRHGGHNINIAAFTATANPKTQREIRTALQLRHPLVFRQSPYRDNLQLDVAIAWTPRGRRLKLLRFITLMGQKSGLVYTRSRRDSEALQFWLQDKGFRTRAYHAGLSAEERRSIEHNWLEGSLQFVICTCAFGMGINKPDVRWIAHYQPPLTLNEYIQEIGRAGRDGRKARVLMLVSEPSGLLDPQDQRQRQYFSSQLQEHRQQALRLAKRLPKQGFIPDVLASYPHAEMSLSLLHSMRQLVWDDPMNYRMRSAQYALPATVSDRPINQMAQFIRTHECRWQYILAAFGFSHPFGRQGCGHCDRCKSCS